jgi:hypothetical protein
LKNLLKEIGGWPLIDDIWDESKYDWINALIVVNRKLIGSDIKIFLTITVAPDIRNMSRSLIQVSNDNRIEHKICTKIRALGWFFRTRVLSSLEYHFKDHSFFLH